MTMKSERDIKYCMTDGVPNERLITLEQLKENVKVIKEGKVDTDITYCFDVCNNRDCFRHRSHIGKNQVYSMAFLKDTDSCPYNECADVPCEIEPITELQAIDKLNGTGWLAGHDQELVRNIVSRIEEHNKVVIENNALASSIGKECYIMAHDHIISMLKKEWGIDG